MFKKSLNKKKIGSIFLTVVLMSLIGFSLLPIKYSLTLEVVKSSGNDTLQVFYDIGNGFKEADSKSTKISFAATNFQDATTSLVTVPLPDQKIKGLRIDPGAGPKVWNLKSIILEGKSAGLLLCSHRWLPEDIVRDFAPFHAIDTFSVRNQKLFLNASEIDPSFTYKNDFRKAQESLKKMARNFKVRIWIIAVVLGFFLILLNNKIIWEARIKLFRFMKQLLIPFSESQWIFPGWFWVLLIVLAAIKLWLVGAQTFPATYSPHDDMLYINLAQNIVSGKWLGDYNYITLAKGPAYPIWIAFVFLLGIPLALSQHVLYIFSGFIFMIAIYPLFKKIPLLFLVVYATLLFHPVSYEISIMARVIREGFYASFVQLLISFGIGLLLRIDSPRAKKLFWSIGLGVSFAVCWLAREESVCLLPSLFVLFLAMFIFSKKKKECVKLCGICLVIFFGLISTVACINKLVYGVFTICEQTQRDFTRAYGSLLRVKPKPFQRYLPVPRETRERIYTVSPAFAELKPYLEDLGRGWAAFGPYKDKDLGMLFYWALRDAAGAAGYCTTGDVAAKYYRWLASEVNAACDKGLLECSGPYNSLAPPWRSEYFQPFLSSCVRKTLFITRLEGFSVSPFYPSREGDEIIHLFQDITRDRISSRQNGPSGKPAQERLNRLKVQVLKDLLFFYRFYVFVLTILGLIAYACYTGLMIFKRRIDLFWVIMTALFVSILSRVAFLSYVEVVSWPNLSYFFPYQSSVYPVVMDFSLIAIMALFWKDDDGCGKSRKIADD